MIRIRDINMKPKLTVVFLLVGLVPLILVGWWSSQVATDALMDKSDAQLENVREIKKAQIEKYFAERQGDMGVLVDMIATLRQDAYQNLAVAQDLKKAHVEEYFQTMLNGLRVVKDDPYVMEAMTEFNRVFEEAGDRVRTPEWNALVETYEARLHDIMQDYGWDDLYLVHTEGDVVYSVMKEADLGLVIPESELQDIGLGKAFRMAQDMEANAIAIADFEAYAPLEGKQAAFMMAQMRDRYGILKGYIAFRMPTDALNAIVQQREGMGHTGETYLVGKYEDTIAFRSDLLTMGDGQYVIGYGLTTPYIEAALAGESGEYVYTDSAGKLVLVNYDPLNLPGLNWVCISKIDLEEAIAPQITGEDKDFYAKYTQKYGYYDLFLIHPQGEIFYSVA